MIIDFFDVLLFNGDWFVCMKHKMLISISFNRYKNIREIQSQEIQNWGSDIFTVVFFGHVNHRHFPSLPQCVRAVTLIRIQMGSGTSPSAHYSIHEYTHDFLCIPQTEWIAVCGHDTVNTPESFAAASWTSFSSTFCVSRTIRYACSLTSSPTNFRATEKDILEMQSLRGPLSSIAIPNGEWAFAFSKKKWC